MFETLAQMLILILLGHSWHWFKPAGVSVIQGRQVISALVFYLFLPALILEVLWQAELGVDSYKISIAAVSGVLVALLLSILAYRMSKTGSATAGAMLLAAAFPNVTYLGLPVLEAQFGSWARSVAVQYDMFATTPLLLTAGFFLASRYGSGEKLSVIVQGLFRVPAIWATLLAVSMNLMGVTTPPMLESALTLLAGAVVPLMLIALGMSLRLDTLKLPQLMVTTPVLLIQLVIMPVTVLLVALASGLSAGLIAPVVIEAAMPSMMIGLVLCDRYRLNTELYATAVTVSTILALFTLPLWYKLLDSLGYVS